MIKKLIIFPIDRTTTPLARYAKLKNLYEVYPILPPQYFPLENKDLCELDGGDISNVKLYANYLDVIKSCDIIYISESTLINDNSQYNDIINYAKKHKKELCISRKLGENLQNSELGIENDFEFVIENKLLEIDTPIISIFTSGDNCDQQNVELTLRKYFMDKDYKVSQIGTQTYSKLLKFQNIPEFIFKKEIDINEKIKMFNRYVYELQIKENPDLIIIGIPEGIMKYNNKILNGLGVIPFIISSAVQIDIGIMNLYHNVYNQMYFKEIMLYNKYRHGIGTKYINIANTKQLKNIDNDSVIDYLMLRSHFVVESMGEYGIDNEFTIFNSYDYESSMTAFNQIENELISNISQI